LPIVRNGAVTTELNEETRRRMIDASLRIAAALEQQAQAQRETAARLMSKENEVLCLNQQIN